MKGQATLRTFLAEHGTDARWLFSTSTNPGRVALRAKLIRRMSAEGLNNSEISRVLNISLGTVRYWLQEDFRKYKIRRRRVNHERSKIYRVWDECAKAMEAGA